MRQCTGGRKHGGTDKQHFTDLVHSLQPFRGVYMNERLRYRFAAEACVFAQGLLPPPHRIQWIDKKLGRRTSQVAAKELDVGRVGGVGGAGGVVVVGVVVGGCGVGGAAVSDGGGVHLVVLALLVLLLQSLW